MAELNDRHASLRQEAALLQEEIAAGTLSDAQIAELTEAFAGDVWLGIEKATLEDKRRIFDLLAVEVLIAADRQARVTCRLPVDAAPIALLPTTSSSGAPTR